MKSYLTVRRVVVAIGIAALLTSCTPKVYYINLWYDPVVGQKVTPGQTIALVRFADMRENPDADIGRGKIPLAAPKRLRAKDQDVGAWVANALAEELTNAGYVVEKFNDVPPSEMDVAITGAVTQAYVCPKGFGDFNATVRANVTVTKVGVPIISKQYLGERQYSDALGFESESKQCEKCLQAAVQNIMRQLVPDIISAIE